MRIWQTQKARARRARAQMKNPARGGATTSRLVFLATALKRASHGIYDCADWYAEERGHHQWAESMDSRIDGAPDAAGCDRPPQYQPGHLISNRTRDAESLDLYLLLGGPNVRFEASGFEFLPMLRLLFSHRHDAFRSS